MDRFNLSAWAIRERSLTLYFILITIIAGTVAFLTNGRAEDPEFSVNAMVVSAYWPGATVEEMEQQVAEPLEKRLEEIDWFDRVETKVRPGRVDMLIWFADSTPSGISEQLFYQVRKRLGDEARSLPQGVIGPIFQDDFADVYFTLYSLTAADETTDQAVLVRAAEDMKRALRRVEGVKKVVLIGERRRRIFIDLDVAKLARLGLSADRVQQQIAAQRAVMAAGFVETGGPRLYVRVHDQPRDQVAALRQLPLVVEGRVIRLEEVAHVYRGYEEPPTLLIRDRGREAVLLGVVMKTGYDGLKLEKALQQFEADYAHQLPVGITLDKITNQADAIHQAVDTFQAKFFMALLVVMVVSFIALGFRAGIIVALAVPLTLGMTFVFMKMAGINFDRISLGALIIALGLLVDDAIISIEMMLLKMAQGLEKVKAAAYAWTLTAAPMLVGTLVTAVGFLPIGLAQSRVGEYAGNLFWVTGMALLASWLVAVLFTPYLGVALLPDRVRGHEGQDFFDRPLFRWLRRIVTACVRYKWAIIGLTVAIFLVSVVGMKKAVTQQFFPSSDRPELLIDINLPEGSSFEATDRVVRRVEAQLLDDPDVRSLSSYVGRGSPRFFLALNPELPNPAYGNIVVVAHDWRARDRLQARLQRQIEAGAFPEARVRVHPLLFGPPVPWPVSFRVLGPEIDTLIEIAERIRARMAEHDFLIDPHLSWRQQALALRLVWDEARLLQLGLTPAEAGRQLQRLLNGMPVTEVLTDIRTTTVYLRGDRRDVASLEALPIRLPSGETVPLMQLATVQPVAEYPLIERRNRERVIAVNAEVTEAIQPPDATMTVWQAIQDIVTTLPPGYRIEIGGSVEESSMAQASIKANVPLMILLMTLLIMLYVRSFTGLFMVLVTAPLGLVGAVFALVVFDQPFGFVANLGLIALGGILMRNTLILTAQIDENVRAGMPMGQAVVEATIHRTRPVTLTALAAVLAFIPLTTSVFWGPMAYVLIGGVAIGTLITLFFLPALYAAWHRVKIG